MSVHYNWKYLLAVVYFRFGFPDKKCKHPVALEGKFHLTLNCVSSKWSKGGKIFEYGSADNMALPQNYNLIQGWIISKSNQKCSHDALPLVRSFRVANTSWYLCLCQHVQKVQAAQQKSDCSRKHFDPNFKRMFMLFELYLKNEFIPISLASQIINNDWRKISILKFKLYKVSSDGGCIIVIYLFILKYSWL